MEPPSVSLTRVNPGLTRIIWLTTSNCGYLVGPEPLLVLRRRKPGVTRRCCGGVYEEHSCQRHRRAVKRPSTASRRTIGHRPALGAFGSTRRTWRREIHVDSVDSVSTVCPRTVRMLGLCDGGARARHTSTREPVCALLTRTRGRHAASAAHRLARAL
eukprot:2702254-Prymnesium_polylepis.1